LRLKIKKDFIQKFIEDYLPKIKKDDIEKSFNEYWNEQKENYLKELSKNYFIGNEQLKEIIDDYFYTNIFPQSDDLRNIITSSEAYKNIEGKTLYQKKKSLWK